jgi:hypothetical protein
MVGLLKKELFSTVPSYSVCPVFDSLPGGYYPDFVSFPGVVSSRRTFFVFIIFSTMHYLGDTGQTGVWLHLQFAWRETEKNNEIRQSGYSFSRPISECETRIPLARTRRSSTGVP